MVKADAYNHGLKAVSEISSSIVDRYGVATIDEAIALRKIQHHKPISIYSYEVKDFPTIIEYGLTPIIYNKPSLDALLKYGYQDFDVKIDSGMHRFGFWYENDIAICFKRLKKYGFSPRALITHFASRDSIKEQVDVFNNKTSLFFAEFPTAKRILSASSGIREGLFYDGVRVGFMAYDKALKVYSSIIDIRKLKAGDKAGYDGDYVASKDTRIAIINGGYYDGIRRAFNGAEVLINGRIAHIIGKVSMDTTMIDIEDIPARIGDRVLLLCDKTIDSYCLHGNTNEYEILTSIKGRNKRAFTYYGKRFD